jgi:hypothetical protein
MPPASTRGAPLGCPALDKYDIHPDVVTPKDGGIVFYHRNLEEWTSRNWLVDLAAQQMPTELTQQPSPMTNITFGGLLTGGAGGSMVQGPAGPMQQISASASATQSLTIAGTAGRFDDGIEPFLSKLESVAASAPSRADHSAVWEKFWAGSDITITPAAKPTNPATASMASRVTLLDRVTRVPHSTQWPLVRKRPFAPFVFKNDHFAKTGSGQT